MNRVERIGRFEVQERLRANSFVIVYRGRDPFDGRRVSIKFCVATDETIRRRFLKAAERASVLRHPNVATVFEFGSGDGKPYLVQESFSEESLGDLLARAEPVDPLLKLLYLVQIARGLQYAHNLGVLHRELRPAAVLIDRAGEAKIADFGTARLASAFNHLGNGAHRWPAVGWLVPELLLGLELDARSDIYAFGAVAFELLTGQAPFRAESLAGLVPQILETDPSPVGVIWNDCPPDLDRLVLRCLARDPAQRFDSMNDVVTELDQVIPASEPVEVFKEEKTVVVDDAQTIYLADLERSMPDASPVETVAIHNLAVSQVAVSPIPAETAAPASAPHLRIAAVDSEPEAELPSPAAEPGSTLPSVEPATAGMAMQAKPEGWAEEVGRGMSRAAEGARHLVGRARSVVGRGLRRWTGARLRPASLVIGSLLVFGIVGWSLVRAPQGEVTSLPTEAPPLPVDWVEAEKGLLVVDAQPWGEVTRVIDQEGREVELSVNRFTPLALELAPGRYTIEIARDDLGLVRSCVVEVESSIRTGCELELAALDPSDLFKEIGWWQ